MKGTFSKQSIKYLVQFSAYGSVMVDFKGGVKYHPYGSDKYILQ